MAITTVLLDVDGTLLDSNDAHAHSWVETLAKRKHAVPFERVRELIGKGGDKLLWDAAGLRKDSPEGKAISEERAAIFKNKYLPSLRPFPCARDLLQTMRRRGLELVVATSARGDELHGLLQSAGVDDLIPEATTSSDADHSKPDPDIVEAALARVGCPPESALMLGDTPYDVEAANRARVRVVALRCGGWDDAALAGAVAIYDSPRDLLSRFDGSPFATADVPGLAAGGDEARP